MILIDRIDGQNFVLSLWATAEWAAMNHRSSDRLPYVEDIVDIVRDALRYLHPQRFRVEARYIDRLVWDIRFRWLTANREADCQRVVPGCELCDSHVKSFVSDTIRHKIERLQEIESCSLLPSQGTVESRRGVYGTLAERRMMERVREEQMRRMTRQEVFETLRELEQQPCAIDFALMYEAGLARIHNDPTPSSAESGVGDTTCKNNARSPHLRCAVNPCGPCEGCSHYEPIHIPK